MKTKEELNALKEEMENLSKKLRELTEEELAEVTGGFQEELLNIERQQLGNNQNLMNFTGQQSGSNQNLTNFGGGQSSGSNSVEGKLGSKLDLFA